MFRKCQNKSLYWILALCTFLVCGLLTSVAEAQSEKQLVVVTWGGSYTKAEREAFYDPFEKETGVKIIDTTVVGEERYTKLRAQVESGKLEWDIPGNAHPVSLLRYKAYLEKIDYSIVRNTKDILKDYVKDYYLGGVVGGCVLCYNKKAFPTGSHPKSWADFWDVKKFPGRRALSNYGSPEAPIAYALLADGVPPDKLVPFDYARAFKKLDEIKPYVSVWWTSGAQLQQIMRDEEVVLAAGWDGRVLAVARQGFPLGIEWNQGYIEPACWAVVKGAKHKDLAMKFLDYTNDPKRQAVMSTIVPYAPTNVKAFDYLPPGERENMATFPGNWDRMFRLDPEWLVDHKSEVIEKWSAWLAK